MTPGPNSNKGWAATAAAFAIWGAFPLYFHLLQAASALQLIAHRIVWSCVVVLIVLALRGEWSLLRATLADRGVVRRLTVSAILITLNWLVYVWAVIHGRVIEASLGYFIGPLVNVLLGVVLLSERLTRTQWAAVALAAIGVCYLTLMVGSLPWIALTLAVSFSSYGLIRKVVKVEALAGLATETVLLVPVALLFLVWCELKGVGVMGHMGLPTDGLLIGTGPLTAVTLLMFAYGTRLLPYSTVGVLQYITPTLQFLCGVFVLHEPFDSVHKVGFTLIWLALLIYIIEGMRLSRRRRSDWQPAIAEPGAGSPER